VDDSCTQVIRFGAYGNAAAGEAKAKVKASANGGAVKDEKTFQVKVAKE
jgi:hypothetical protein